MSKKAKAKNKIKRLNQKRARKAAKQAQYEAYKKAGQNKKSKRFRATQVRKTVRVVKHAISYCGNLGCKRCFPMINDPKLAARHSCLWMKQFTSRNA